MIEIDKNDFLYKHLIKLGVENVDELYLELSNEGITNLGDLKRYLYSQYGDDFNQEIEEDTIKELLPYYLDSKKEKKVDSKSILKLLKEYKLDKDSKKLELIINSKLQDMFFIASLYKNRLQNVDVNDIVQTCNMGLLKAIEKYQEKSRITFDEFVEFWVSREVKDTYFKENYNG